jgi:hypothetical protein
VRGFFEFGTVSFQPGARIRGHLSFPCETST